MASVIWVLGVDEWALAASVAGAQCLASEFWDLKNPGKNRTHASLCALWVGWCTISWQVLRSDCNLRWIQLGDATSAGQFNLLRQWQRESILDDLVDG